MLLVMINYTDIPMNEVQEEIRLHPASTAQHLAKLRTARNNYLELRGDAAAIEMSLAISEFLRSVGITA